MKRDLHRTPPGLGLMEKGATKTDLAALKSLEGLTFTSNLDRKLLQGVFKSLELS